MRPLLFRAAPHCSTLMTTAEAAYATTPMRTNPMFEPSRERAGFDGDGDGDSGDDGFFATTTKESSKWVSFHDASNDDAHAHADAVAGGADVDFARAPRRVATAAATTATRGGGVVHEGGVAARDAAFEEALARARASRRVAAQQAAARAAHAREFYREELKHARGEEKVEDENLEPVSEAPERRSLAWRGDFAAFDDADRVQAPPRPLPKAWSVEPNELRLDLDAYDEDARRSVIERFTKFEGEGSREASQMAEMSEQIRRLNMSLSACERRESAAELAATAEAERAASLEQQCMEHKARVKARDADIGELNKVMFVLKKRVDDLTDALDEARRDAEKYRMEIAELKVNDQELRRAVERRAVSERTACNVTEQIKRDALALQSKVRALEEENSRLNDRLRQSEDQQNESARSAQRFHTLAETSARELEILRRANDAAAQENAQLREQVNDMRKEIDLARENRQYAAMRNYSAPPVQPPVIGAAAAPAQPRAEQSKPAPAKSVLAHQNTSVPVRETSQVIALPPVSKNDAQRRNEAQRGSKENVPAPQFDSSAPFDASEYKRRMRDGSGFFYDMSQKDAPSAQVGRSIRRTVSADRVPEGHYYMPPPEPVSRKPSYDEWMKSLAVLENENMRLCLERSALEDEINRLPAGAGRNMLEREKKASALERLDEVHKAIRVNRDMLKSAKRAR